MGLRMDVGFSFIIIITTKQPLESSFIMLNIFDEALINFKLFFMALVSVFSVTIKSGD